MNKTVIIADNQDITFEGLCVLLPQVGLGGMVMRASSRNELLAALKKYPSVLVVLDYTLFDFSGPHEIINIKGGHPEAAWLLFSDELGEHFLRQVLFSGQSFNIVMKGSSRADILAALQATAAGKTWLCEAARHISQEVPRGTTGLLSPSERDVLYHIALGKTTKEIAYDKHLSFHTINTHRKNIFRKLEVNNVHEAIKYALRAGIIDVAEYCI